MSTRITRSTTRISRMWQLRFPPEVWDIVFTQLGTDDGNDNKPQRDLKNASLTCRTFSAVCERHIWHSYTLQIGESAVVGLANFLKKNPRLANYIREVAIHLIMPGVNSIRGFKSSEKWLEQLPSVLDQLHNVTSLSIMPDERAAVDFNGYEYHLPFIDLPSRLQSALARLATIPRLTVLSIRSMHYFPLEILWAPRPERFGIHIENVECACAPALLLDEPKTPTPWYFLSMADDGMHNSLKQFFEFKKKSVDGVTENMFVPVDFRSLSFLYWRIGDQYSLDTLKEVLKRVEGLEVLYIEAPYFNNFYAHGAQPPQAQEFNILKNLNPLSFATLRRIFMTSMGGEVSESFQLDSLLSELSVLPCPCNIQSIAIGPIPMEQFQSIGQDSSTKSVTSEDSLSLMNDFWPRLGQALGPEKFPCLKAVVLRTYDDTISHASPTEYSLFDDDTESTKYLTDAMYPPDADGKMDSQVIARQTQFVLRDFCDVILPHPYNQAN